ncbi:MAG: hypothetical protein WKG01_35560 [Kofleriaceae bacterium]
MMKTVLLGLAFGSLVACGGGAKPEPKQPEPAPIAGIKKMPTPTCAATSDTMTVVILASNETQRSDAEVKEIKNILKGRCESDGWSDRAKECLATMESEADADGCASMLTAEQRQKIVSDERIKLGTGKPAKAGGEVATPASAHRKLMAGVFTELERFRSQMCACKDKPCSENINGEFMKWAQDLETKFGPDFKPDDKDQERLGKLVMEYSECYSKLAASEASAPPPPPAPKAKPRTTRGGATPSKPASKPRSSDPCMGGE